MYFLYKDNNFKKSKIKVIESKTKSYNDLKKEGFDLCGQFGREDYANHWADYKNGKISEKKHRIFLNLIPYE